MSTFTIFAKGPRAVLLTDTAGIDMDGVLRAFAPKLFTLPHLRMAITMRGAIAALPHLATDLGSSFASFDAMIEGGEEFFERAFDQHMMRLADQAGSGEVELALVGWSDSRAQCEAYVISSFDYPGLPACTFMRQEFITAPALTQDDLQKAGLWANGGVRTGEPTEILLGMIELQRRIRTPIGGTPGAPEAYIVGGQCIATEITKSGISQKIVREWPDKLGEIIRPNTEAPMSDAERRAAEKRERKRLARAA